MTKATENKNADTTDAEAEAAEIAAQKAAREREAKLEKLHDGLQASVAELKEVEGRTALEVRAAWISIGELLNEGKALFITDKGTLQAAKFSEWITEGDFDKAIKDRNQRTHAMWLASVYNDNPDLYALIPSEGTDVKRSPTTIQRWVKEQLKSLFQQAHEDGVDVNGFKLADDAEVQQDAMTSLFTWAKTTVKQMQGDAKNAFETSLKIAQAHSPEDLASEMVRFKPTVAPTKFKDREIDDAAAYLTDLLMTHEQPMAVYTAMKNTLEEAIRKATEEAEKVEESELEEEDVTGDDSADDFEEDAEGFDDDDLDDFEDDEDA